MRMQLHDHFPNGKYQGNTLLSVFQGKDTIDNYLVKCYIDAKLSTYNQTLYQLNHSVNVIDFEITETAINCDSIENDITQPLQNILKAFNTEWSDSLIDVIPKEKLNPQKLIGNISKIVISGKPGYIEYCIKKWNDRDIFYVDIKDYEILKSTDIYTFEGIRVERFGKNNYRYDPIVSSSRWKVNPFLEKLNTEKYNTNIEADLTREKYLENLNEKLNTPDRNNHNWRKENFNALTDGTMGDYDDFKNSGRSFDDLETWLGF